MNLFGREVDYVGKVININKREFRLSTEEHNHCLALTLKFKDVLSFKKISEPKKEPKVHSIKRRKQYTNLKEPEVPEGL